MTDLNFLSINNLIELTTIANSVDPDFLIPYVRIAEEMYVEDVLGNALTSRLKNEILAYALTGNSKTLVERYIIPCSAFYTWYEASMFLNFKTISKGIVKQSSDTSENVTKEEFDLYRTSIKEKAIFYRKRLLEFLNDNKTSFPEWKNSSTNEINTSKTENANGVYLGNYKSGRGFNYFYNRYYND